MEEHIKKIETQQETHTAILQSQTESLKRLETAILGDEKAGIQGMVSRVQTHEDYITKDKKAKWWAAGFLAALALFKDKIIAMFS